MKFENRIISAALLVAVAGSPASATGATFASPPPATDRTFAGSLSWQAVLAAQTAPAAQAAPQASPAAPAEESDKARATRLRAEEKARKTAERDAEKARKTAEREAEKQRKAAERKAHGTAHPGRRRALGNCAKGAVVGVLGALVFGRRKGVAEIVGSAVAGCITGWGLGEALKGKDEENLDHYISDDYVVRDDVASSSWQAPESGQTITVETVTQTTKSVRHTLSYDADVVFDPANIQVNVLKMRATQALRLRSSPDATGDTNIKGVFDQNEIVEIFGRTTNGEWSYVIDRQPDGSPILIGYVSSDYVVADLRVPASVTHVTAAKPKAPPPPPRPRARAGKRAAPVAAPIATAAAAPPRRAEFMASTRCKSVRASAGGRTSSAREFCGGAKMA